MYNEDTWTLAPEQQRLTQGEGQRSWGQRFQQAPSSPGDTEGGRQPSDCNVEVKDRPELQMRCWEERDGTPST